ncbi:MAG: hypothetical protein J6U54_00120 [Clostridiales bacterium]|nr:hypothetical protein [Clostridiales bacterium]
MTNTTTATKTENKVTAKQALFDAIFVTVICVLSLGLGVHLAGTIAPLAGIMVFMSFCIYTLFKRYINAKKEESV